MNLQIEETRKLAGGLAVSPARLWRLSVALLSLNPFVLDYRCCARGYRLDSRKCGSYDYYMLV